MERPNAWLTYSDADMQDLETVAKKYRHFLNVGKTERECITQIVKEAEEAGYVSLEEKVKNGEDLKAGDKVYQVGMQKIIALYHIGEDDLAQGMNILCAHIDSPRLDIKQNPLYEDTDLAYLDTHYYGGVKKYQWVALPMAMHGVIVKKDGTVVNVTVGEDEDDPVINADDAACAIAESVHAEKLAFLSDIEGVYRDKDDPSSLISELHIQDARKLIEDGYVGGGMIPKLNNCIEAIEHGVNRVHILDGRIPHSLLLEIFTNKGIGTAILREDGEKYYHEHE